MAARNWTLPPPAAAADAADVEAQAARLAGLADRALHCSCSTRTSPSQVALSQQQAAAAAVGQVAVVRTAKVVVERELLILAMAVQAEAALAGVGEPEDPEVTLCPSRLWDLSQRPRTQR